ncbi:sugar phosphate isomerase/epimerase family protein [Nocardia carnea]|uniref:sugar phosphate isomerase/epimerase family protein n=1 Tax=Nocardia carnea TaxID=37328 RepID=UPI00245463DA|nr:sugar phosphate isomerase/epimerase [Nocardia carnea]
MKTNPDGVDETTLPPVGLEHLTLYTEPLSVFVAAAAAGGAETICMSVGHPDVHDRRTLREALMRLDSSDLSIAMGDGFLLNSEAGLDGLERKLEILIDMGATSANTCAFEADPDRRRTPDHIEDLLGEFCRLAHTAGVDVLLEFTPLSHVPSLAAAADLVKRLDQPNLRILVDTLHLARAGEGPDDIGNIDRQLIGYCQISDGPMVSENLSAYMNEAMYERAIPGHGQLPLAEILSLLSRDVIVSAEVPLRSLEQAGVSPAERAERIIDSSRRLLARARA